VKLKSKIRADIVLITLLIIANGNNPFRDFLYIISGSLAYGFWVVLIVLFYIFFSKRIVINNAILMYYLYGFILVVAQFYVFPKSDIIKAMAFFVIILFPYLIIKFINKESVKYFPIVMVRLIQLSFIFWIPTLIFDLVSGSVLNIISPHSLFQDVHGINQYTHAIIHNFRSSLPNNYGFTRNCGMFWEPGAFAGTIMMVYIIFIYASPKYYTNKQKRRIDIWLSMGLISTFSTTGLIVFPILFFIDKAYVKGGLSKRIINFFLILPVIIIIVYFAYIYLPVLNEKIIAQYELAMTSGRGSDATRFGSLVFLWQKIVDSPWLGTGMYLGAEWKKIVLITGYNSDNAIGNGMFIYIAKGGVLFFIGIMILMFKGLRNLFDIKYSIFFIFILMLILQGENWMGYPLIYAFMFFDFKNKNNNDYNFNINSNTQPIRGN